MQDQQVFKSIGDILASVNSKVEDFASFEKGTVVFHQEAMKAKLMDAGLEELEAMELVMSWREHVVGMINRMQPSS